jgi:hypothetical protein
MQEVELTDDAVDAALRALEELLAHPQLSSRVVDHPGLVITMLALLQVSKRTHTCMSSVRNIKHGIGNPSRAGTGKGGEVNCVIQ